MDEARIREQIAASERVEVDGSNIRQMHARLDQALEHYRIVWGHRSEEGRLRSERECWDIVEEVFQHLTEGVHILDEAVEQAVALVKARGPCNDETCQTCHPPTIN
jgi:cytochrome c556